MSSRHGVDGGGKGGERVSGERRKMGVETEVWSDEVWLTFN